jgi:hypothetical protein
MSLPKTRGFQRALGVYLRQNHHGRLSSGKLTPRQRRRLWRKYPDEMARRAHELWLRGVELYGDARKYQGWF